MSLKFLPVYPKFKSVSLRDRSNYQEYISGFNVYSDFIFTNLLIWRHANKSSKYSRLNDNLVIKIATDGTDKFKYTVIGKNDLQNTLNILLEEKKELTDLPIELSDSVDSTKYKLHNDRDAYEYIYKVSRLVKLRGNKYDQRRREINKFRSLYPDYEVRELDLTDNRTLFEVNLIYENWFKSYTKDSYEVVLHEYAAFKELLSIFPSIKNDFLVLGIFYNNTLVSFQINEMFKNKQAYCHFIKYDLNFRSSSSAIFYQSCVFLNARGIKYLNFDHDVGLKGLRQYKTVWRPIYLQKKFSVY